MPLFFHLWPCIDGGGQCKYGVLRNFCLQACMGAERAWRYIFVSIPLFPAVCKVYKDLLHIAECAWFL